MTGQNYFYMKQHGRWGFIDGDGNVVIPPQLDYALDFADGRAVIKNCDKWGFIDIHGNFAIELGSPTPRAEVRAMPVMTFSRGMGYPCWTRLVLPNRR